MKIPLHIAEKLLLLANGQKLPGSAGRHAAIDKMVEDGIVARQINGRSKSLLYLPHAQNMAAYLKNNFGIADLQSYIAVIKQETVLRAQSVAVSSDSKLIKTRTFKGFLVNSYQPIPAVLNGEAIVVSPSMGSYVFIADFESFVPAPDVTIVGIENPENFRYVHTQKHLFPGIKALFVSRYPHSADLIKWLAALPNKYIHFGDFDFSGINIYLNEYKKHLGGKATFLVPPGIADMVQKYGNRHLYNTQNHQQPPAAAIREPVIAALIATLHQTKKCLEQEVFVNGV